MPVMFGLSKDFVGLRGHDEIILVKAPNLVSPPLNGNLPPLGNQQRMMILLFGDHTHLVRQSNRFNEVLQYVDTL